MNTINITVKKVLKGWIVREYTEGLTLLSTSFAPSLDAVNRKLEMALTADTSHKTVTVETLFELVPE